MREAKLLFDAVSLTAKTGFLTKSIFREIAKPESERSEQRFWQALNSSQLFQPLRFIKYNIEVLRLTSKGRQMALGFGTPVVSSPHIANVEHDEMAAFVGLRLQQSGLIRSWSSEAILKQEIQRDGISAAEGPKGKYPDILIELEVTGPAVRVAIEIERTGKPQKRYDEIIYSYGGWKNLDAVIFAFNLKYIESAIRRSMSRSHYPQTGPEVIFTDLKSFIDNPSNAKLKVRSEDQNIATIVKSIATKRKVAA